MAFSPHLPACSFWLLISLLFLAVYQPLLHSPTPHPLPSPHIYSPFTLPHVFLASSPLIFFLPFNRFHHSHLLHFLCVICLSLPSPCFPCPFSLFLCIVLCSTTFTISPITHLSSGLCNVSLCNSEIHIFSRINSHIRDTLLLLVISLFDFPLCFYLKVCYISVFDRRQLLQVFFHILHLLFSLTFSIFNPSFSFFLPSFLYSFAYEYIHIVSCLLPASFVFPLLLISDGANSLGT